MILGYLYCALLFARDEGEKQLDNINTFYNGKGYTKYEKNDVLKPSKLTLGFDFSTFDENSLIYLAAFDETSAVSEEVTVSSYTGMSILFSYISKFFLLQISCE